MRDSIVIGGGPAGLSAAINLRNRGKDVLLISSAPEYSGLWKAPLVDNYPGVPGISGKELLEKMIHHAQTMGVDVVKKRVLSVMPASDKYFVSFDNEVTGTKTIIIACGAVPTGKLEGETELLGKGVSYCATCDGMLYRGKKVVVTGDSPEALKEAEYLAEIGCKVYFVGNKKVDVDNKVEYIRASKLKIIGDKTVYGIQADGETIDVEGVFIIRKSVAPGDFMPGLEMDGGYITVDRNLKTNLIGVWAAGDCVGKPLQIAKAVGEGQIAALNAADYLESI